MPPESSQPIVDQYHNYEIEYWVHETPDTLGRLSRVLIRVSANGVESFGAVVDVTSRFAANRDTRGEQAMKFARQYAHGLIDTGLSEISDQHELVVGERFDRVQNDSETSDEELRLQILAALRRMHQAQALTGHILYLDVDGLGLVLRVASDRIRSTIAELITEGLVEGYAESFGAIAADGRCRITGPGLGLLRESQRRDETEPTSNAITDWSRSAGSQWADLEVRLNGLKDELDAASDLDGFQDVGRRCREILIDVANLVFSETMVPDSEETPGRNDAKARLDLYLRAQLPGRPHRDLRKLIRQAHTLANSVTHSNSADRPTAFAAAQATILIVRTLQEIDSV